MEEIKGYDIPFDIKQLRHRVNLVEQDGPLLALYYNDKGDDYLFYWVDSDDNANRWMILRVTTDTLYKYINGEITLLQVLTNPSDNFLWITDVDNKGNQICTKAILCSAVPADYLPDQDSWFVFDHQDELLKNVGTDNFEVDIPKSDKNLFATLMSKMGWKLSSRSFRKLIDKVAL
jgi:hypothetical protein